MGMWLTLEESGKFQNATSESYVWLAACMSTATQHEPSTPPKVRRFKGEPPLVLEARRPYGRQT
ncbi:hypothetical protein GCM10009601_60530 [Streptomyces thermospinosisporus]|uniref:Transposase n=1 Tax=Streptomyces thermospinosisporus TaxID=161482 RepID=A0ABN1Z7Z9_9ACTN